MNKNSIVSVSHLTKTIKKTVIVNDISFEIQKGDILGFLGPNGAGKSTTIKAMLGLISATEGKIHLCGFDIQSERSNALKQIGAMVESPAFYNYMTGYQNLELYAELYNISKKRIDEVLELVHLYNDRDKKVGKYSLGMKQRLGIARAFLNSPQVIILDEPTNGLDPVGIVEIRNIILKLAKTQNISFVICSHILGEIEAMCNKLLVINNGSVIANGYTSELIAESNCKSLEEYYIKILGIDTFA